MTDANLSAEQILEAVREEATKYGRCCDLYQDSLGQFHCHDCGQRTFAMLAGVQQILGGTKDVPVLTHEEAYAAAVLRRAAPDLLAALVAIESALRTDSRQKDIVGDGVEYHIDGQTMGYAINLARTAIAKAKEGNPNG